jgi:hypothetical protein
MNYNRGKFSTLNPEAELFKEIRIKQPPWWKTLRADDELYIDIRKDNYINVYYLGGSLAKIDYKNGFVAEIHSKYLEVEDSKGNTYIPCNPEEIDRLKISDIKRRIEHTLRSSENEHPSEKRIQGELIIRDSGFIDSEFQYNQDIELKNLRIDLIELKNCILSFVELKGISDSRLRNDEKRNPNEPEIIKQMRMYETFISRYESELTEYYKKLLEIKSELGLKLPSNTDFTLNLTPKLLIANTYRRVTKGREERKKAIESLLCKYNIDYEIVEWKS